jgi:hypothetical protein
MISSSRTACLGSLVVALVLLGGCSSPSGAGPVQDAATGWDAAAVDSGKGDAGHAPSDAVTGPDAASPGSEASAPGSDASSPGWDASGLDGGQLDAAKSSDAIPCTSPVACTAPSSNGWFQENPAPIAPIDVAPMSGSVWWGGSSGAAQWSRKGWTSCDWSSLGTTNAFYSDGAGQAWAAGSNGTSTLVMRFDGQHWCPLATGPASSPNAIWAANGNDLWVAGAQGALLHWNGTQLEQVSATVTDTLGAAWGTASDDVWFASTGHVLHWDGSQVNAVETSTTATTAYTAVTGTSSTDVWALMGGVDELHHWNGLAWSVLASRSYTLRDAWSGAPGKIWGVRSDGQIVRDDGSQWQVQSVAGSPSFSRVRGRADDDVWAVSGQQLAHGGPSGWTPVGQTGQSLMAASGTGLDDEWAVGTSGLILHRVPEIGWTRVSGPGDDLFSVSALGPSDVWVAGKVPYHYDGSYWTSRPFAIPRFVTDVHPISATEAWMVTQSGSVLRWDGNTFSTVSSGTSGALSSVWGLSTNEVWLVGASSALLHWNGNTMTATTPAFSADFSTVWGSGSGDVWAACGGNQSASSIQHWQGSAWQDASLNIPASPINGLWGTGPNDVWAVGGSQGSGGSLDNRMVVHWNGTSWSRDLGAGAGSLLNAIGGDTTGGCWTGGSYGAVLHWNGQAWSEQGRALFLDDYEYDGKIACTGAADCWAVTNFGSLLHFDGRSWGRLGVGASSGIYPRAIRAVSPTDVWAAGQTGLLAHWDGSAWRPVGSPTGLEFSDLLAFSTTDVWAIAHSVNLWMSDTSALLHWDGTGWAQVGPLAATTFRQFWGAASDDLWIVTGDWTDPLWHWDGHTLASYSLPGSITLLSNLAVGGTTKNDVWISNSNGYPLAHWNGTSWSTVPPPNGYPFSPAVIHGAPDGTLFMFAYNGLIVRR